MGVQDLDHDSSSKPAKDNSHFNSIAIENKENGQDVDTAYKETLPSGHSPRYDGDNVSSESVKEVFSVERIDPVLARKMALVNESIDSIGMTGFQWKMFVLNGFGYAVDSVRTWVPNRLDARLTKHDV